MELLSENHALIVRLLALQLIRERYTADTLDTVAQRRNLALQLLHRSGCWLQRRGWLGFLCWLCGWLGCGRSHVWRHQLVEINVAAAQFVQQGLRTSGFLHSLHHLCNIRHSRHLGSWLGLLCSFGRRHDEDDLAFALVYPERIDTTQSWDLQYLRRSSLPSNFSLLEIRLKEAGL